MTASMEQLQAILQGKLSTIERLAKKTRLDVTRLRALAEGAEPSVQELRVIAKALKMSLADLAAHGADEERANILFRQTGIESINPVLVDSLSRRIGNFLEVSPVEPQSVPGLGFFKMDKMDYSGADQAASALRDRYCEGDHLSPLFSLPQIVSDDMQIPLFTLDTPNVDGASAFLDGQAFIFVSSRFPPRMLFTLAHELGHLIASGPSERGFAVMDPVGRTGRASRGRPIAELFADTFAGCVLLPAAGVGIALKKVRELLKVAADAIGDVELLYLSRIFGVSFQVAARRCEDLGLLPIGGAKSIYDFLRREFGSPEKRAELLHLPARPEVKFPVVSERLLRACIEKVRIGDLSLGRAAMILGLSSSEIVAANAPTTH